MRMNGTGVGRAAVMMVVAAAVGAGGGCVSDSGVRRDGTGDAAMMSGETGMLFREVKVDGEVRRYAVYVPRDYDAAKAWPAIVFLNGSGECGTDGQKHLGVGLAPAIMMDKAQWPFIVIFPQKPEVGKQWESYDSMVMAQLEAAKGEWNIDAKRISLTGLSQGGHGSWILGARHSDVWAAAAPLCGYARSEDCAEALARSGVPVWAFHGEKDTAVNVEESKRLIGAVKAARGEGAGEVKLSLYPELGHNCWDQAYRNEKLGEWLAAQKRP